MRIYADACIIVYLVESRAPLSRIAERAIDRLGGKPGSALVTSALSRLECRVGPLRGNDQPTLRLFDDFFRSGDLEVVPIAGAVVDRATDLRAHHGFKTPDAIHLATAIEAHADVFLTGDARLARCSDLRVEVVREPEGQAEP
jgi:predicted nucleic acid-binding protein